AGGPPAREQDLPETPLLPGHLYPAARPRAAGAAKPPPPLRAALSYRGADAPGYRWGPQASRGRDRGLRGAPHLEPTTAPSPPSALCPARRGPGARRDPVDPLSATLLPARPGALETVSAAVP